MQVELTPARPIVRCLDLVRSYQQGQHTVRALQGVTLTINKGDFATLAGPSGSGKSTLLNMIGALDRPTKGEVQIGGVALSSLDASERAELRLHKIGFVFQAYNLVPVFSALENVSFVLQLSGVDAQERRERAMRALRDLGLAGMEDRRPSQLSGGQQQRVAVARALVSRPAIILADEPTANLDRRTAEALIDLLAELNDRRGTTFLMGTHDQRVIDRSRRHIVMTDGKIVSDDVPSLAH